MLSKEITSLQHPLIKHLVKLRKNRQYRHEMQSLLITGKKLVTERAQVDKLILLKGEAPPPPLQFQELYSVTPEILDKIAGHKTDEPFAAELPLPAPKTLKGQKLLVLDGINDPGNLGTLLRTALALGFEGVYLTKNSADLFNDKALSAAKGATFHLPYQVGTQEALWTWIETERLHPYAGDLQGKNLSEVTFTLPLVLILGNEAHGPSEETKKRAKLITIPLASQTESLNVGIAGGILMYQVTHG